MYTTNINVTVPAPFPPPMGETGAAWARATAEALASALTGATLDTLPTELVVDGDAYDLYDLDRTNVSALYISRTDEECSVSVRAFAPGRGVSHVHWDGPVYGAECRVRTATARVVTGTEAVSS